MAEKYGTIPKRFTKAWWGYFWDYYKVHTIVIVLIIIAVTATVYQSVTKTKYDYTISFAASRYAEDEKLTSVITQYLDDIDNNGEKNLEIRSFVFSEDEKDPQYLSAMLTKLQLQFLDEECMLFIFDADKASYYLNNENMYGIFQSAEEWMKEIYPDMEMMGNNGQNQAVSLKNSTVLNEAGIKCDDLYVAVRAYKKEDDKILQKIEKAKEIANILIR